MSLACAACSTTLVSSPSPDRALTAEIVQVNGGATTGYVMNFDVITGGSGRHTVFSLDGPYTARLMWKQPRLLQVIVVFDGRDDPEAWNDIERQIAELREVRFRDLNIVVGTPRQFGLAQPGAR